MIYRNNILVSHTSCDEGDITKLQFCLFSFACNSKDCSNEKKRIKVLQYITTAPTKYIISVGILQSIITSIFHYIHFNKSSKGKKRWYLLLQTGLQLICGLIFFYF